MYIYALGFMFIKSSFLSIFNIYETLKDNQHKTFSKSFAMNYGLYKIGNEIIYSENYNNNNHHKINHRFVSVDQIHQS